MIRDGHRISHFSQRAGKWLGGLQEAATISHRNVDVLASEVAGDGMMGRARQPAGGVRRWLVASWKGSSKIESLRRLAAALRPL